MRVRADQPGECLVITGSIIVEGISTEVTLTVNTIQLIHILGDKACRAKGRKSQLASGLVKCKVDSIVQSVLKDKRDWLRERQRDWLRERQRDWLRERQREESTKWAARQATLIAANR